MALAISFTLLWWLLVGMLVLLWRKITNGLSEYRYVELMASFGIGHRPTKLSEKIFPFFSLFAWAFFVPIMMELVQSLQKMAIGKQEGLLFLYDQGSLMTTAVAMSVPFWIMLLLAGSRFTKPLPQEKWKKQPMLWEMQRREQRIKYLFLIVSLLIQFAIYYNIYDYLIVEDDKIHQVTAFNQQKTTHLENVATIFQFKQEIMEIDGVDTNVKVPSALLVLNNMNIELWSKLARDDKKQAEELIKLAKKIKNNNGQLIVEPPTLFDKSKIKKRFSEKTYKILDQLFSKLDLITQGISGKIPLGEAATYNGLSISAKDISFTKSPANSTQFCEVKLDVTNNQTDSTSLSSLLQFKLKKLNGNSVSPSLFHSNPNKGKLPQNETISIQLKFPTDSRDSLILEYKPDLIENRFIYFKLY